MGQFEYYDFGLELSPRENVFLTKVVQQYRFHKAYSEGKQAYAYFSQEEKRRLLGNPTFRKRVDHLKSIGVISEINIMLNPNNSKQFLKGYIPIDLKYTRVSVNVPYLEKFYEEKWMKLSTEAAYVYETMKKSTIDITDYQLAEALVGSCKRHGYADVEKYVSENSGILSERIADFNHNSDMYVVEDSFGDRLHTFVTTVPQEVRKGYLKINGNATLECDQVQSQMVILGKLLETHYGDNSFSRKVREEDVYVYFGGRNGIKDRGEAKRFMYRAVFDRKRSPSDIMFKEAFPDAYPFIENMKSICLPQNPSWKWYSNVAYMLQREESGIFRLIWRKLEAENIPFLTVHDSIIVEIENGEVLKGIMSEILRNEIGNHIEVTLN